MGSHMQQDRSNGYEDNAEVFIRSRNHQIGVSTVVQWSRDLAPGSAILDLGCGHGVPISQALHDEGFQIFGVDASATLIQSFKARFPEASADCAAVEESDFFHRTFGAALAWGLLFLMAPDQQRAMITKVARALAPDGRFLFTAPEQAVTWEDSLTGRLSISLGADGYSQALHDAGLILSSEAFDEGDNHYYFALKPAR